jgi:aspartate/glutamate racemase/prolyl-tRNA editing enzyme YbaK/EbsC (Cys-tRNA(Pro) deacylase)
MIPRGVESAQGEAGETAPPQAVRRTTAFLEERGVWFRLGRNHEARSCRDAAHKRNRLGEIGIPLWDELKSFFGVVTRPDGRKQHFMVHCRGDRVLNLERVAAEVGGHVERLDGEALEQLGLEYGLVNPFGALDGPLITSPLLQVFDRDLLDPIGVPGTVMTNAGDPTWSVELHAMQLVDALQHVHVADVSATDPKERPRPAWAVSPATIGILTGNGPESGMMLWRMMNTAVREALGEDSRGDIVMPRVVVQSIPELGLTMELDRRHRDVWPALRGAVLTLCRDGAKIIAVACNTTPYFTAAIRELTDQYGAVFVSIAEVAGRWLKSRGIDQVALVGVRTVADLGEWSPFRVPLAGIGVEVPNNHTMGKIHELAYDVKSRGADQRSLTHLRSILQRGVESDVVLLALTEISLVLELQKTSQRSERLLIDTMQLYADELARRYLNAPGAPALLPN